MSWQQTLEQTVTGLGYDLVDLERSPGGLLRVTIDWPWDPADPQVRFVTVEDCETVTRQLQYLLEVENVDYKRLEVGSPGIDRPLRHEVDYVRFAGEVVDITLKEAIGEAAGPGMAANRKKFRGTLERADDGTSWQIVWTDEPERKPGQRVSKKAKPLPMHALGFTLDEVRDARLAPIVNFKGRDAAPAGTDPEAEDKTLKQQIGKAGE
ncbi:ribosome maturation factor RimP [Aquabacterium sp. A08]|uniref:ribosome maturation factor RimP n=1 Tax=Aquabacterium sp. A08 TaxID=2718532 RepID=UPI001421DE7C|nr:ribosome maturation factor RimP [Aquabacterium sp. A08]NIC42749.1 ribosome maturation factor RimP [Aquabacterium sp. A08]